MCESMRITKKQGTKYTAAPLRTTQEGQPVAIESLPHGALSVAPDGKNRPGLSRLAWLPVPLLFGAMILLWALNLPGSHESVFLVITLNLVCSLAASAVVAFLVGRGFLVRGSPGLLLLGCGAVAWGPAALGSVIGDHDPNVMVTIHNGCAWLSAFCHLTGVLLSARSKRTLSPTLLWLPIGYTLTASLVTLIALATFAGRLPVFFVQGQGGTPLRQLVLTSSIIMFALTALLLEKNRRERGGGFNHWYALALSLVSVGLLAVVLQSSAGSAISWTGRAAQFVGGAYMLIAAIASVRESRVWGTSLEASLKGSKDRLQLALDAARMGTWDWDLRSGETVWNDEHYRILGYRPGELKPSYQAWAAHVHPEDLPAAEEHLRRSMERCTDYVAEYRVIWPDGTVHWAESRGRFDPDRTGKAIHSYGVLIDITERKAAEEATRRSEALLRAVLDASVDCIFLKDRDSRMLLANPATFAIAGKPPEAVLGKTDVEFYDDPATGRAIVENDRRIMESGQVEVVEESVSDPAGTRVYLSTKAPWRDAQGNVIGLVGVGREITEQKRAEEALRQSEERYRRIVETAEEGIATHAPDGTITYVNQRMADMLGYSRDEIVGRSSLDFMDDEEKEVVIRVRESRRGKDSSSEELKLRRKDGSTLWTMCNIALQRDDAGNLLGYLAMHTDITEHKKAEETLRESEERLRSLAENVPCVLMRFDRQLRVVYLSRQSDRYNPNPAEKNDGPDQPRNGDAGTSLRPVGRGHRAGVPQRRSGGDGIRHGRAVRHANVRAEVRAGIRGGP
jgi:PAS domain S-box-containing protein